MMLLHSIVHKKKVTFMATVVSPLINQRYKPLVVMSATAIGLAIAAVAPWEAIKIIGITVLTGFGYGVANDMIACRDCIEYFTVGHFYDGRNLKNRPLNTLNPTLNALAWGAIATWHVCAIAGTFFSLLARIPFFGLSIKITAIQLAPYLAIGAAIALLVSHVRSRLAQKEMVNKIRTIKSNSSMMGTALARLSPYIRYQKPLAKYFHLKYEVPLELQAGWEACNVRNMTGYASIGIGGALLSIAMIAARAGLFIL
ncbi:MAG: hypothetical protein K1000chlam1_00643 [Candidatus Anoxychlamydiales bacterium]|nr:hypothetical protein [Candidatus Anoxychlamydiales bacterium]